MIVRIINNNYYTLTLCVKYVFFQTPTEDKAVKYNVKTTLDLCQNVSHSLL